ncbi:MAG TPA: hypothetical protein VFD75_06235 [Pyrinomonadaceae bacterium]|nr:hypothetical protein [Pyrinomonadaceae bacterium]
MISELWFQPPLAFARFGNPNDPLEAFHWGPNDELPSGTGKTTILPAKTFIHQNDGSVLSKIPDRIVFASDVGVKAVCPFFELHGAWQDEAGNKRTGRIDKKVLTDSKLSTKDLVWNIKVANLKPFFMTQDPTTRIEAELEIQGDDFVPKQLQGRSPQGMQNVLVPEGKFIPLGTVLVINPSDEEPACRLRFFPPAGEIYGPTNFRSRVDNTFQLPENVLFLNQNSSWCRFKPGDVDTRGFPGSQYAQDANSVSLGLVDDASDGIISCRVRGTDLVASARIVVAPPHLAPDRRHFVSIADGLKDRMNRAEVYDPSYFSKEKFTHRLTVTNQDEFGKEQLSNLEMAQVELHDLLERVLETMWLSNLDAYNHRIEILDNPLNAIFSRQPYSADQHKVFDVTPTPADPLPLVDNARRRHRRLSAFQILQTYLRQRPGDLGTLVRTPLDPSLLFDKRMPALMHGSYGEPLYLTRRQFELVAALVAMLRANIEEES